MMSTIDILSAAIILIGLAVIMTNVALWIRWGWFDRFRR